MVAVGFQEFDARKLGNYGYGRFPNVITSLELERMLNASGVTEGHVVRPSDLTTPKRIVFVQCVGARGEGGRPYCSRFCCMNAVKDSMLIRQHDPEVEEITILYTDLRAFGKGFDDFVQRSFDENSATYVRGRPAKIERRPRRAILEVFVEDTLAHEQRRDRGRPRGAVGGRGAQRRRGQAGERPRHRHRPATASSPGATRRSRRSRPSREGVFVCGSAVGPQVIPDCVAQASAAAARAQLFLTGAPVEEEEVAVEPTRPLRAAAGRRAWSATAALNIAGVLDVEELAGAAARIPGVVVATGATCSPARPPGRTSWWR